MSLKSDHRSKCSNLSNWKEEAWKNLGLRRNSNPWPPRYRGAMLDQLCCEATHWKQSHFVEFISSRSVTYTYKFHIISLHGKIWTQQNDLASNVEFIYSRSVTYTYKSHIFSLHGKTWTQQIDLAPNVWLHMAVTILPWSKMMWNLYANVTVRDDMNSTNWPRSKCVTSQLSWSSIAPVSRRSRVRISLKP